MKFNVLSEPHFPVLQEGFYVDIEMDSGDGDAYEKIRVGRFIGTDYDVLENLIFALEEMLKVPSGYEDRYDKLKDFQTWFCELGGIPKDDYRYDFFKNRLQLHSYSSDTCYGWQTDEGNFNYRLTGYNVFFVSSGGKSYKVEVEK